MRSTKWVRPAVLATAVMAVAWMMAVLACGPTAVPAQQSGSGEAAELTLTPTPVCWTLPVYGGGTRTGCEEPGPPNTDFSLRMAIKEHKEQSAKRARGESAEPVLVNVQIYVETETETDELLEFLDANAGDAEVHVFRATDRWWAGQFRIARLDAGLIEAIHQMEGVIKMATIHPLKFGGSRLQQDPSVTPTLTAAQVTHADQ